MVDGFHFKLGEKMELRDERGNQLSIGDCVEDVLGRRWLVCGAEVIATVGCDDLLLSAILSRNGEPGALRKVATSRGAIDGHTRA